MVIQYGQKIMLQITIILIIPLLVRTNLITKNVRQKLQHEVVRLSIKIIHNMICRSRRNRNNLLFSKQNGNSKSNGTSSEIDICEIIRKNTGRVLMTF